MLHYEFLIMYIPTYMQIFILNNLKLDHHYYYKFTACLSSSYL